MSGRKGRDPNSLESRTDKVSSTNILPKDDSDDTGEREHWGSEVEFLLSCLGYAIGLGDVWRFPYICYINGGGAFLIPYLLMCVIVGLPVFFIELSVGQFAGASTMTVWSAAPLFQGVGAGMIIISFIGSIYYIMIIAWALYYMFAGFTANLPWASCTNDYNTAQCYSKAEAKTCETLWNGIWWNQTCYNNSYFRQFDVPREFCNRSATSPMPSSNVSAFFTNVEKLCYNYTKNIEYERIINLTTTKTSPSEEYFNFHMLDKSERIEDGGKMKWELALVLLLAWILCFLCVFKSIRSSGKVVYFTATFPYVILLILFFRGVTLPGAGEGIRLYLVPDWKKLGTAKVWVDAVGQNFFSLGVSMGGLMTYASYNKFHHNILRDTLIVTFGNCLTSFFAGFVIFSILGFMANELGKTVHEVAASGSGLAFIAYPEVVSHLPAAPVWSFLFFFMLVLLGLDSEFAGLENLQTAVVDMVPRLRKHKMLVAAGLCVVMYILGLSMCMQSGIYWLELMSYYASGRSLILIGMAECMVFAWVYVKLNLAGEYIEKLAGLFCPDSVSKAFGQSQLIYDIILRYYETCLKSGHASSTLEQAGITGQSIDREISLGSRRLLENIEQMLGYKPPLHYFWWFTWTLLTPVILVAILVFSIYQFTPLAHGSYVLPAWAQALGWVMSSASVVCIPIFAVYRYIMSYRDGFYDGLQPVPRLLKLLQPHPAWKPAIEKQGKQDVNYGEKPHTVSGTTREGALYGVDNPGLNTQQETRM